MKDQAIAYIVGVIIVGFILYHTWIYIVIFLALVGAYRIWELYQK